MKILLTSTYVQRIFYGVPLKCYLSVSLDLLTYIFLMGVAIREGTVTALYSLIRPGKCGGGGRYVYLMFGVQSVMESPPPLRYSCDHCFLLNFVALRDVSVSVPSFRHI
jgi:hypothetical protein